MTARGENPAFAFRTKENRSDDWQTPAYALEPLLPYLKKDWLIWECSAGKGNIVRELRDHGHLVYASDIKNRRDFLKLPRGRLREEMQFIVDAYDCVVTNPPYSLKQQFLERAYELGKPFAFLMPLFTFEGPNRQSLFRRFGLEVIMIDRRISFAGPPGQKSMAFAAAWFTWKLHLGRDLVFSELSKRKK